MSAWLLHGAPHAFSLEQDLELESGDAGRSTVRYKRHPLDGHDIRAHLSAGKRPTQLGLTWNGRISFILTEKLQIKRLQFLELAPEREDGGEIDPLEQFDIDFTVMAGELTRLLAELRDELGGEAERAAA
jgi:recombination associated protein RdgC